MTTGPFNEFDGIYSTALLAYLADGEEGTLKRAYELGRKAIEGHLGTLDVATAHEHALLHVLEDAETGNESYQLVNRASDFFVECLSPFEMTHRGFQDTLAKLSRRSIELASLNQKLAREIVERKQAEEILRSMPQRILNAQEDERKRVAMDLHDDICQRMSAIKLSVSLIEDEIPRRNRKTVKGLRGVERQLDLMIDDVRRLSSHLHPASLHEFGLVRALRQLCQSFEKARHIGVRFAAEGMRLPGCEPHVEVALYRIAQEALSNIGKHAKTKRAVMELRREGDRLTFRVQDFGRGFDVAEKEERSGPGRGLGLLSMRERAALIGGRIAIASEPKKGTTIRVDIEVGNAKKED